MRWFLFGVCFLNGWAFASSGPCYDFFGFIDTSGRGYLNVYVGEGRVRKFVFSDPSYSPNLPIGVRVHGRTYLSDKGFEITKNSFDIPSRDVASTKQFLKKNKIQDRAQCLVQKAK